MKVNDEIPIDTLLQNAADDLEKYSTKIGKDGMIVLDKRSHFHPLMHEGRQAQGMDQLVYEWDRGPVLLKVPKDPLGRNRAAILGPDASDEERLSRVMDMMVQAVLSENKATRAVFSAAGFYLKEFQSNVDDPTNRNAHDWMPVTLAQRADTSTMKDNYKGKRLEQVPIEKWKDVFGITTPKRVLARAFNTARNLMGLKAFDLHYENWAKDKMGHVVIFDTSRFMYPQKGEEADAYIKRMDKFESNVRKTIGDEAFNEILMWGAERVETKRSDGSTSISAKKADRLLSPAKRTQDYMNRFAGHNHTNFLMNTLNSNLSGMAHRVLGSGPRRIGSGPVRVKASHGKKAYNRAKPKRTT